MCIKHLCHHHCYFSIVVDAIKKKARRGIVNEVLYADGLVVISETMED